MRRGLFQIAYISGAILLCLSCGANSKDSNSEVELQYSGEKSKLSAQLFENFGYQVKDYGENLPGDWHKENFQTARVRVYQVKSRTSLREQPDTFPRYTVVEEVYETEESAAKRLERIQEKPPNLPVEQEYYWMVTGFRHQKNIYFIQTDASAFNYYMKDFAAKLDAELQKNH